MGKKHVRAFVGVGLVGVVASIIGVVVFVMARPSTSLAVQAGHRASAAADDLGRVTREEELVAAVSTQLLQPWEASWQRRDMAKFTSLLDASPRLMWATPGVAARELSGIHIGPWGTAAAASVKDLGAWLSGYGHIDAVTLEVHRVSASPGLDRATLELWLDVRGVSTAGARIEDRGPLTASVAKTDAWRLDGLVPGSLERVESHRAFFRDATARAGLANVPTYLRLEAIRRGGYAVALADYDGDGHPDLYLGAYGAGRLYRNRGDGSYEDMTVSAGLGQDTMVKAAAFLDLNNSGRRDLVLTRFVDDQSHAVVLYRNVGGGHFQRVEKGVLPALGYDRAMPMAAGDFNGDGLLDLYVGFPGARDFTVREKVQQARAPQGVFLNRGDYEFLDATVASMINKRWSEGANMYPHAALAADWNGSGKSSMLVVDDRRNGNAVYDNDGQGHLQEVGAASGLQNAAWGMGVALGDYDGDGLPDIYFSNVDLLAAKRMAARFPAAGRYYTGNRLYHNLGNGRFEDVTDKAGVGWAGEGAGGCAWIDFDGDGRLDLYVTNGLWTGSSRSDISSSFVENLVANEPTTSDAQSWVDAGAANKSILGVLQSRRENGGTVSMGGRQRKRLFHNNGDGTFTEVGHAAGVDAIEDGYMPAVADYDGSGRPSLVLRNADPGTDAYRFPTVRVLQNVSSARYLELHLQGAGQSNRDAIGATVTVWCGGQKQVAQLLSINGASQSEPALFFGLRGAARADKVSVRWPDGRVETHANVPAGRVLIAQGRAPKAATW